MVSAMICLYGNPSPNGALAKSVRASVAFGGRGREGAGVPHGAGAPDPRFPAQLPRRLDDSKMSEISVKHPKSYRDKSRIQEETQITLSYLYQTIALIRHLPDEVSNFRMKAEQIPTLYALESPALSKALDEIRGTAHALREVLEERWHSQGKQSKRHRPTPGPEPDLRLHT
jgi:hypothetical protein